MAKKMILQDYEVKLIKETRRQRKELIDANMVPVGKSGGLKIKRTKRK